MQSISLQGQFLIAMPSLEGSFFEGALIYLIEHNSDGAFGLIVNQQLAISVGEVLKQLNTNYDENLDSTPVINGGPVDPERGFILHRPSSNAWQGQLLLPDGISLTNSNDILESKAHGEDIGDYVIALGYSGWSAGQLEEEMGDNVWLNVSAPSDAILSLPISDRLNECLKTLGINYQQLSSQAGHS